MPRTIEFTKMHGAGNDFVVIDHRRQSLPASPGGLFARLCDRRRGIGADGVLLLEASPPLDFAMRYYNADGEAADFCGNGARCLARFALDAGLGQGGEVRFATAVGEKRGRALDDGRIALSIGTFQDGSLVSLDSGGRVFRGRHLVTGVPHLVIEVDDLDAVPLMDWAPPLRHHSRWGPEGANVDFVARLGDGRVAMRTYERGVEGETLACGSGAIACARWAMLDAGMHSPVVVRTRGGDELRVEIERGEAGPEATLIGPAVTVFAGTWREGAVAVRAD